MRNFLLAFLALFVSIYSESVKDHWKAEEYAKNSDSQRESAQDFMQGKLLKGNETILDVGCGDGKITAEMARAVPQGRVVGVDSSASMIHAATQTFGSQKNLSFQVNDAALIDFDQTFDLITSFTVMHWVLEQKQALCCFQKALKSNGKLWIQIPTGLPLAMEQALEKTISNKKWNEYFKNFSPPWRFYSLHEYQKLLEEVQFVVNRLEIQTKHESFSSREVFHGFLKQWFPYLRPIPQDQKDAFLHDLLDSYLCFLPLDEQNRVSFIVDRLEVEAKKLY